MKKKGKKKVAAAPLVAKKAAEPKKVVNPLLEKRPRNYGIGNESRPCGDSVWKVCNFHSTCPVQAKLFDIVVSKCIWCECMLIIKHYLIKT